MITGFKKNTFFFICILPLIYWWCLSHEFYRHDNKSTSRRERVMCCYSIFEQSPAPKTKVQWRRRMQHAIFFSLKKTFKARKIGKSTSPDFDWISSLADLVESFLSNGTSKDSCAGCSVSGLFVGVVGNILNELGANVLVLVLQVDGLSYCHSIFRNLRAPPTLFNYDIPSLQIRDISNLCLFC